MYQQTNMNEAHWPQGDANELFTLHYKTALRTANRILRSREDSEDAVQNAYCAAIRHFQNFRGESSFNAWLTRIVVICCLMQLRERRARPQVALDDRHQPVASHTETPEALCYQAELRNAHTMAASKLPQALHDIYTESVLSEVASPNVVHHLGLTPAAAKARLFRARRRVERSLRSLTQGMVA